MSKRIIKLNVYGCILLRKNGQNRNLKINIEKTFFALVVCV